jgi:hypothetical protein
MSMSTNATAPRRTYGAWHANRPAGLFGLGTAATLAGFATVIVTVVVALFSVPVALGIAAAGLAVLAPMAVRVKGRTGAQIITAHLAWWVGAARRRHLYRTGLASPYTREHRLPGLLATSRLLAVEDGRTRTVGVIAIPGTRHLTAVLTAQSEGADLVDQDVIDQRVAHYSAWLASLSREPGLVQAQIIVETAPDPGTRLAAEVEATTRPDAPELAREVLTDIVRSYPAGSATVNYYVALTWRLSNMDLEAGAVEVASRLPALQAGLEGTGAVGIRAAAPDQLIRIVARAYNPSRAADIDAAPASMLDWAYAGPVDHDETRDTYLHDGGASRTWGWLEAPRGAVVESLFGRLLVADPTLTSKRVSLLIRPLDPEAAARAVESDRKDATFNAGKKPTPSARDLAAVRVAEQAADEEARGAGVARISLLATLTVPRDDNASTALAEADRRLLSAAGEARIRLRLMGAAQSASFAGNLPCGVVLPRHAALT